MSLQEPNDLLRLIDQHAFHNPLVKTCHLCRVEIRRQGNYPEVMWSKALARVLRPPTPVLILILATIIQTAAIAALLSTSIN